MKNTSRNTLFLLTIFLSLHALGQPGQTLDVRKIKKHTSLAITGTKPLSDNKALQVKTIYAVTFADKSVRLYDSESDTLSQAAYNSFVSKYQTYLGATNGTWQVFEESRGATPYRWNWKASLDKGQFDSINILYFGHFLGYKDGRASLFYLRKKGDYIVYPDSDTLVGFDAVADSLFNIRAMQDTLVGFNEIPCADPPVYYEKGLFVKLSSADNALNGKIAYLDFETGQAKSNLLVDSILNKPSPFVDYLLVKTGDRYFVYSYKENKLIDDSFSKHYVVPIYDCPLVLTETYVGLGHHGRWKKFDIEDPVSVEFEIAGDLVFAHVLTKNGDKYKIDLWRKKMAKE